MTNKINSTDLTSTLVSALQNGSTYEDLLTQLTGALDAAKSAVPADPYASARDEFVDAILVYLYKTNIFPQDLEISSDEIDNLKDMLKTFEDEMHDSGVTKLLSVLNDITQEDIDEDEYEDIDSDDETVQKILELLGFN